MNTRNPTQPFRINRGWKRDRAATGMDVNGWESREEAHARARYLRVVSY